MGLAGLVLGLASLLMSPLAAQAVPLVDPEDVLGIWDFNNAAGVTQAADSIYGTPMTFQGSTVFSASGAGRSGLAGDRAIQYGTTGGNSASITDAAFLALLNQSNTQNNQITVVFWQRWATSPTNSSSVWITSASQERGFQAHLPYGDGTVYFDTSGCCDVPAQRLSSGTGTVFPGLNWQDWHHIALVKNGGTKEIWIDGQLLASQASGVSALLADWTAVGLGMQAGTSSNGLKGWQDDFAIFGTALQPAQIAALAGGASPDSLAVAAEDRPPVISGLSPAANATFQPVNSSISFTATTHAANSIQPGGIRMFLDGVEVSGSLSIGGTAINRTISYSSALQSNRLYSVRAEVSDTAGRTSSLSWTFDTANPATTPTHKALDLPAMGTAVLTNPSAGSTAGLAMDGKTTTITETANVAGSAWELELERSVRISRIQLTAPAATGYAGVLNGVKLRVYNLRDQLVYETTINNVATGGSWAAFLPAGIDGRIVRLELPPGQTNGAGDFRIALAELQVIGDASPAYGPLDLAATATATQSSTANGLGADLAIDGNAASFSETSDVANSSWLLKLDRSRPVRRVELVNRADANASRMGGLTLRLLNEQSATLATASVSNPGAGGTWGFDVPAGTADVRYIKIGLENNAVNGQGNRIVSLAGVSVLTGVNYALNTEAYMVRLTDSLPSPALANDGNHATYMETTDKTVDGYWETDLGSARALYAVRAVAFDNADFQIRLRHATLRLFDENHESVYSKHLSGNSAIFDIALPGPVKARYVRIGFENKERSSLTGGIEWWLRLREVQAFGRPVEETGITSFTAAPAQISAGQSSTLGWQEEDLRELTLYPGIGPAGSYVNAQGAGSLPVTPAATTEYVLVGKNHLGTVARYATVQVDGQELPPRISEFVASNRYSLRDGDRDTPDWIELRNPNATPLDLAGYYLSDNAANPTKWSFPAGSSIPPHGFLLVFASGKSTPLDAGGFLHASFSLSSVGESVVLTAPDGSTVVDSILNYPAQQEDLGYGRSPDGATAFFTPTPAALNLTPALAGWLEPPVFSHSHGFRDEPFSLTLSQPDPEAELWISTSGAEPDTLYTGPIPVSGTMTVRATVRRAGYQSPRVRTQTYLFRSSVMASPLMNTTYTQGELSTRLYNSLTQIPTICVSVPQLPDDYNEREASLEVFLPDGSPPLQVNAGFNRVGGSWTNFAKKSYRFSFRAEYGNKKLETPLLRGYDRGMAVHDEIDTLDIGACNHDMVERGFYMASRFVEDSMLEMGSLNPHGRFVHVYVNGTYWGQYNAHERLEDSFLADYLGGQSEDYVNVRGNDNDGSNFVPGTPEPPNRQLWESVRANRSSYAAIKNSVDIPHLIDFMLLWYYGNSEGEFRCAGPIAPGSGFKFWLADADGFLRTSALSLDTTANSGPGGILGALLAEGHPDFKALVADRIYQHFFNNGAMTPERNLARLNARMDEVKDSMIAECARWGYRTPSNWEAAAQTVRTGLFPQRTANLFTLLRNRGFYPAIDPPLLSQHGGSISQGAEITLTSGTGTIYYTTDDSDPRLPGGGVAPGAQTVTVSQTNHITRGSQWRYRDLGSLPAANWYSPAYNDSAWSSGAAPLGYGTGDEATIVSYGPSTSNKYTTTYFRKSFTVTNPAAVTSLTLGLIRDDGAVVYLNGTEALRVNMPTGTIGYTTRASTAIGADKTTLLSFPIDKNLLVAGTNVIAVEMHQSTTNSADLRFDLSLSDSALPRLTLDQNTRLKTRLLSNGNWSALADATFHVAHPLIAAGPYLCQQWAATSAPGSAPAAMRFFQTDLLDPGLSAAMNLPWTLGYGFTSRSRINGLGADGFSFVNTGSPQVTPGAGYVGAAVLALNTLGAQDVRVTWTGGTVVPNVRDYGIRLQYRVGDSGSFLDVPDANGNPVEYLSNPAAGHEEVIGPVSLPAAAENRSLVELRWKYHFRSGTTDGRPELRVDDIQVTAGPVVAESLTVVDPPATAQAGAVAAPLHVRALGRNGAFAGSFSGAVTVSLAGQPGLLGGTTTRQAEQGSVTFDDLVFPQPGTYTLTAAAAGLPLATSTVTTRVVALHELVMPRFIQGTYPLNQLRVPCAYLLRLDGLLPNATYRYANQIVIDDDAPEQEGAGNMTFPGTAGAAFIRSLESPRFLPGDLHTRHGEFVTDASGSHTRWFITEPTGNIRFTPGNTVRTRILLNDGNDGDLAVHSLTAASPMQVLPFGTGANDGSALYGTVPASARNLVLLYEDAAGTSRPLAATPVEATGALIDSLYAPFYQNLVAGQSGRWGTILPNLLAGGVRRIEERDLLTGAIVSAVANPDGLLPTTGVATGATPTGVRVPAANASGFALWQSRTFTLDQLDNPAHGGTLGDADADQVSNLLEYAFGLNPFQPDRDGLPATALEQNAGNPQLVFRYRRLTGNHGLDYQPLVSGDATSWQDATGFWTGNEETTANPDGRTETVTRRLPMLPAEKQRFLRLRIQQP